MSDINCFRNLWPSLFFEQHTVIKLFSGWQKAHVCTTFNVKFRYMKKQLVSCWSDEGRCLTLIILKIYARLFFLLNNKQSSNYRRTFTQPSMSNLGIWRNNWFHVSQVKKGVWHWLFRRSISCSFLYLNNIQSSQVGSGWHKPHACTTFNSRLAFERPGGNTALQLFENLFFF